jgi:hypothetical protein
MQSVRQVLEGPTTIPLNLLNALGKGDLRKAFREDALSHLDANVLWLRLSHIILDPDTDEKYLTAVCNCVSVYLSNAASSPSQSIRSIISDSDLLSHVFHNAEKVLQRSKTKPALQVIETVAGLLKGLPDDNARYDALTGWASPLVKTIFLAPSSREVKSACIALTFLVKKTALIDILEDILQQGLALITVPWLHRQSKHGVSISGNLQRLSRSPHLFLAILFAMEDLETRSAASKLLLALIDADDWSIQRPPAQQAVEVCQLYVRENEGSLADFANHVLPLLVADKHDFLLFLEARPDFSLLLYLLILKVGRLKKFITEEGKS